jgi:hypothetical protein
MHTKCNTHASPSSLLLLLGPSRSPLAQSQSLHTTSPTAPFSWLSPSLCVTPPRGGIRRWRGHRCAASGQEAAWRSFLRVRPLVAGRAAAEVPFAGLLGGVSWVAKGELMSGIVFPIVFSIRGGENRFGTRFSRVRVEEARARKYPPPLPLCRLRKATGRTAKPGLGFPLPPPQRPGGGRGKPRPGKDQEAGGAGRAGGAQGSSCPGRYKEEWKVRESKEGKQKEQRQETEETGKQGQQRGRQ